MYVHAVLCSDTVHSNCCPVSLCLFCIALLFKVKNYYDLKTVGLKQQAAGLPLALPGWQ